MKIGLIGFGRLGKLLTKYLSQDFHVYVYDIVPQEAGIRAANAIPATLEEVCQQPIVIPLVPISEFDNLMQKIGPLLQAGALVADVCSVKVKPVESMSKYLPETVSILATHPMFGPDSAGDTLFGSKLVICPVRIAPERYREITLYLEKHGIKLIECTPEEHDQQISKSLFLAHFLGRTLLEFEAHPLEIDTKGYRRLMKILLTVENDSMQLFEDMFHYNPFAAATLTEFRHAMSKVVTRLGA